MHAMATLLSNGATKHNGSGCCGSENGCACPACASLRTFERPRFFAGQLLTETELNLLQQYVIDKHRFHNVHLHGWGVVCGLQVRCDECGDGVIVEPGYAIDPCGNDIVVPGAQRVDVMSMIQHCVQQTIPACDPPRYDLPPGCDDDSTWCLYVRYREWNTRAVTPLAGAKSSCACGGKNGGSGCGCGGSKPRPGWECTCGTGGSANTDACGCGGSPTTTTRTPECEPTRTKELYEFGVCRTDGSCTDLRKRLEGTFPVKAAECLQKIRPIFTKHISGADAKIATAVLLEPAAAADNDPHDAICALFDAVLELYRTDPMRTMCTMPVELSEIDCSPQGPNETSEAFQQRMAAAARALLMLIVAYVRDCVCHHLMPPCPPDPCDDRVVLACMTVKEGRVVSICNFDCRRHAGSFVSLNYWLPIGPLVGWVVGMICCAPLLGRIPGQPAPVVLVRDFLAQNRIADLRRAVLRDDFALVKNWSQRVRDAGRALRPDNLLAKANEAAREGRLFAGGLVAAPVGRAAKKAPAKKAAKKAAGGAPRRGGGGR
jgi:hypothetical protein